MTDQELNAMMRRVIIDSLKLDLYTEDDEVTFKPSLQYQRQTKCMLKDPLKWAAKKKPSHVEGCCPERCYVFAGYLSWLWCRYDWQSDGTSCICPMGCRMV